jgi:hypothetical protein
MATKKAPTKKTTKNGAPKTGHKPQKVNISGVLVPENCQTCTSFFTAKVTLTLGKAKRVKMLVKGDPISKITISD